MRNGEIARPTFFRVLAVHADAEHAEVHLARHRAAVAVVLHDDAVLADAHSVSRDVEIPFTSIKPLCGKSASG